MFVRLIPESDKDLTGLLIFLNTDNVYMIYKGSSKEVISTLDFIVKLNSRYILKDDTYKDDWGDLNINPHVKYEINRKLINEKLFDGQAFKYRIEYSMLYITNNNLLDKHELQVINI